MSALLAERGIVVTDEDRARARRRLAETRERRDPELRKQLGIAWVCVPPLPRD
ncbi:hypothetical protein [Actinoplanes sp. NPDC051859]|uniref:hypothetical protein n=1 Tax=Actinoplanes sp. NPDC051859 TaxID=3363909 RepID=UPI00379BFA3D